MSFEPERSSSGTLFRQFAQYFWVALIGLSFDFGSLVFLTEVVGLNYLVSAGLGFSVGLVVNFFLSERFVFRDPSIASSRLRFALYALIGAIGLGILSFLMWVLVESLGIPYVVSKVFATAVVYAWNFFARRVMYA